MTTITAREAAVMLGVTYSHATRLCRKGELEAHKEREGAFMVWRVSLASVEERLKPGQAWLESIRRQPIGVNSMKRVEARIAKSHSYHTAVCGTEPTLEELSSLCSIAATNVLLDICGDMKLKLKEN
jgi:excisionase family DNA binding protein